VVAHALVQILCIDAVDELREHLNIFLNYELLHTSYKGLVYFLNRVSATLFVTRTLLQHETDELIVVNIAQVLNNQTWKLTND